MASNKELRRRIRSIASTRQITKAMEMVAAAKMRRAQQQALSTRTYSKLAWDLVQNLSGDIDQRFHRLLRRPAPTKKIAVLLITSNRGLIGSFNNRLTAAAIDYAKQDSQVELLHFITLGKKGLQAVYRRGHIVAAEFEKKDIVTTSLDILPIARLVTDDFVSGKYDKVVLIYMDFINTLQHETRLKDLLPLAGLGKPVAAGWDDDEFVAAGLSNDSEYLFEPSPDEVLESLLPRLVEMQIYQALLETNASEHSARMVAMKNATDAAGDLVNELTLEYNQLRQAAITTEISEIVAGQLAVGG